MGFMDALAPLLGMFNEKAQIDQGGFDWKAKQDFANFQRRREMEQAQQANQDRRFKAQDILSSQLGEILPGMPQGNDQGPLPEPTAQDMQGLVDPTLVGAAGGDTALAGALKRARAKYEASKPFLALQKAQTDQLLRQTTNQNRLAGITLQGKNAQDLAMLRSKLQSERDLSPAEQAKLDSAESIAASNEAGRQERFNATPHGAAGGGVTWQDSYDPETGTTSRIPITRAQAAAMAQQNGLPGGDGPGQDAGAFGAPTGGLRKPPSSVISNRQSTAKQAEVMGTGILSDIANPAIANTLGMATGRLKTLEQAAGDGDPVAIELKAKIWGFASLQMAQHNARNYKIAQDALALLKTEQSPEALAAAVRGLIATSRAIAESTRQPSRATPVGAGSMGGSGTASDPFVYR